MSEPLRKLVTIAGVLFIVSIVAGYQLLGSRDGGRQRSSGHSAAPDDEGPFDGPTPVEGEGPTASFSFTSDPALLEEGNGPVTRDRAVDSVTGKGQAGVPYFIEFSDGRYAYGRTDRAGNTRALFREQAVAHKVYWDDEAVSRAKNSAATPTPPGFQGPTKGPAERWREVTDTTAVRAAARQAPVAPVLGRDGTLSERSVMQGSVLPCTVATKGDSTVARACAIGGLQQAKREMKMLMNAARWNGRKFACEQCHQDLDGYSLKEDARQRFSDLMTTVFRVPK